MEVQQHWSWTTSSRTCQYMLCMCPRIIQQCFSGVVNFPIPTKMEINVSSWVCLSVQNYALSCTEHAHRFRVGRVNKSTNPPQVGAPEKYWSLSITCFNQRFCLILKLCSLFHHGLHGSCIADDRSTLLVLWGVRPGTRGTGCLHQYHPELMRASTAEWLSANYNLTHF